MTGLRICRRNGTRRSTALPASCWKAIPSRGLIDESRKSARSSRGCWLMWFLNCSARDELAAPQCEARGPQKYACGAQQKPQFDNAEAWNNIGLGREDHQEQIQPPSRQDDQRDAAEYILISFRSSKQKNDEWNAPVEGQ